MSYPTTHHSFSVELAAKYGVEEAILIHHFQHWIKVNRRLKKNFHEEKYWMYQTQEELTAIFPYLTFDQIRVIIDRLVIGKSRFSEKKSFEPILVKGNFNKKKFDKTSWYAFKDEEKFLGKEENSNNFCEVVETPHREVDPPHASGANTTPIPDTKTDTKKEDINSSEASELANKLFETIKKTKENFKTPNLDKWAKELNKMLSLDKISKERIERVLAWLPCDDFWKTNILSADKLRKQFDQLEIKMEANLEKDLIKKNRAFALEQKQKYPEQLKGFYMGPEYVMNKENGKDVPLKLNEQSFKQVFFQIFGGRYVED